MNVANTIRHCVGCICGHSDVLQTFIFMYTTRAPEPLVTKLLGSQMSWRLETARLDILMTISLWNLTGILATVLPMCMSNFRVIGKVQTPMSRLWGFARSCVKACVRLVNRGMGSKSYEILNGLFRYHMCCLYKVLYHMMSYSHTFSWCFPCWDPVPISSAIKISIVTWTR